MQIQRKKTKLEHNVKHTLEHASDATYIAPTPEKLKTSNPIFCKKPKMRGTHTNKGYTHKSATNLKFSFLRPKKIGKSDLKRSIQKSFIFSLKAQARQWCGQKRCQSLR